MKTGRIMTPIQIPGDPAVELQARAAAQGITLEEWLSKLAGLGEAPRCKGKYSLEELVAPMRPFSPYFSGRRSLAQRFCLHRGDIHHVDLNPVQGREQAGSRFVIIVSRIEFNVLGTPLVCPITRGGNFAHYAGFTVPLNGAGTRTSGAVFCN